MSIRILKGLNPCCSGIWSETKNAIIDIAQIVLILVVVEYGLRQVKKYIMSAFLTVLILVVVEYGLRLIYENDKSTRKKS